MANELMRDDGIAVTLQFGVANKEPNTTSNLTLQQGYTGFLVPTGYKFHAVYLGGSTGANLSAGSGVFNVTNNGTALANGPTVTLNATVEQSHDVERVGVEPIPAGNFVGVNFVADANFAPNTADLDAVLIGLLLPN